MRSRDTYIFSLTRKAGLLRIRRRVILREMALNEKKMGQLTRAVLAIKNYRERVGV